MAINRAIIIKNSKDANGNIIKIVGIQIEQMNAFCCWDEYLKVNTNNKVTHQLINTQAS